MNERTFWFMLKLLRPVRWYINLNGLVHVGVLIGFIAAVGVIIGMWVWT